MNTRRGFSLLEVVAAMGVLSIAILGIMATMVANIRVSEMTRQHDIASNAAKAMLDRVRATPFASIGPAFGDPNNTLARYYALEITFGYEQEVFTIELICIESYRLFDP